ncbi:MAG: DegT/DnrJ/EryC1/StrS family aminotransferase, partial [Planctomycetes bacterium]|nr:DegT/DnrJ/EryC1/StrS family aminotransferase [Planctomycetota bacterium]
TDDDDLADLCVSLRNQGRGAGGGWLAHDRLGYNYRLSDINCALGITQLARLDEFVEKRSHVAVMYRQILSGDDRIIVPTEPDGCQMSWFVFVIRLAERFSQDQRDAVLHEMIQRRIQVSNYFPPAYLQPFMVEELGHKEGDFPVTDTVSARTIALPFHNNLTEDEVNLVATELKACLDNL